MAYATQADMEARFSSKDLVELTNPNNFDADTIDAVFLQTALNDASAIIDARMPNMPSPPPSALVGICCDLTRYKLSTGSATEEMQSRYDNAIKLLKDLHNGAIVPASSSAGAQISAADPVFIGKDML